MVKSFQSICAIAIILISFATSAQTTTWDSTYRPDIYYPQLELYKSYSRTNKDIVFLGNSIIHWTDWNELLHTSGIKNRGIPGDMTFGVLERLDEAVKGNPAKIFILIGINDLSRNVPDTVILTNYTRIIEGIKKASPKTKIYFQTMLPTNASFKKLLNHYKNDHIRNINEGLKLLAKEEKICLIDLYSSFTDKDGNLDKQYTFDGVHLRAKGYVKWAELLKKGKYFTE